MFLLLVLLLLLLLVSSCQRTAGWVWLNFPLLFLPLRLLSRTTITLLQSSPFILAATFTHSLYLSLLHCSTVIRINGSAEGICTEELFLGQGIQEEEENSSFIHFTFYHGQYLVGEPLARAFVRRQDAVGPGKSSRTRRSTNTGKERAVVLVCSPCYKGRRGRAGGCRGQARGRFHPLWRVCAGGRGGSGITQKVCGVCAVAAGRWSPRSVLVLHGARSTSC